MLAETYYEGKYSQDYKAFWTWKFYLFVANKIFYVILVLYFDSLVRSNCFIWRSSDVENFGVFESFSWVDDDVVPRASITSLQQSNQTNVKQQLFHLPGVPKKTLQRFNLNFLSYYLVNLHIQHHFLG